MTFILSVRGIAHQRLYVGPHGNVYKIEQLAGNSLAVTQEAMVSL